MIRPARYCVVMRILPIALLTVALLSGCLPSEPPTHTAAPQPTTTPVFASEEEALAAAVEAYAAYQREVDSALTTHDVTTLTTVADGDALSAALRSVKDFVDAGRRQVGSSIVLGKSLAQADLGTGELVQIYACLDISGTDVVDASGTSVVTSSRSEKVPVLVSLGWRESADALVVVGEEVWGGDYCA